MRFDLSLAGGLAISLLTGCATPPPPTVDLSPAGRKGYAKAVAAQIGEFSRPNPGAWKDVVLDLPTDHAVTGFEQVIDLVLIVEQKDYVDRYWVKGYGRALADAGHSSYFWSTGEAALMEIEVTASSEEPFRDFLAYARTGIPEKSILRIIGSGFHGELQEQEQTSIEGGNRAIFRIETLFTSVIKPDETMEDPPEIQKGRER